MELKLCNCGCGKLVLKPKNRFIHGHNTIIDPPLRNPETAAKFKGDKNPAKRPDVRKKMAFSKLGDKNPAKRPEIRKKISAFFKGKHTSPETEFKKGHKLGFKKGHPTYSGCEKGWFKIGESSWNKGLGDPNPYGYEFTEKLKEEIRARDGNRCKYCGKSQNEEKKQRGQKLSIHHLDGNKRNNKSNNLIACCHVCHGIMNQNLLKGGLTCENRMD